jgi:LAO/AO transport system kinase
MSGARRELGLDALVQGILGGDAGALARAISLVEDGDPLGDEVVRAVFPRTGAALVVGVTGPPGAGKSTLVSALVRHLRARGSTVGVVGVDPSSAFTRGALLGDRIRLADHFLDPGVFIRSMGTRGHLGGLAEASLQAALLLDASGKDVVLLETVGTGQTEIEVARVADVVVLALMPGAGDAVQALKAGIMEIPDVVVVTRADQDGTSAMVAEIRSVVALHPDPARRPLVLAASGTTGEGIPELWDAVVGRRDALAADEAHVERRHAVAAAEVVALAGGRFRRRAERAVREDAGMRDVIARVARRELDPVSAAKALLELLESGGEIDATDAR